MQFFQWTTILLILSFFSIQSSLASEYTKTINQIDTQLSYVLTQYQADNFIQAEKSLDAILNKQFNNIQELIRSRVSPTINRSLKQTFRSLKLDIQNKKPVNEIAQKINKLQTELNALLPQIREFKKINKEINVKDNPLVAQQWKEIYFKMEEDLAVVMLAIHHKYCVGSADPAINPEDNQPLVVQVENVHAYFKASGLEASLLKYRDAKYTAYINQNFLNLAEVLVKQPSMGNVGYHIGNIQNELEVILPELPID